MTKREKSRFYARNRFFFREIARDRMRRLLTMAEEKVQSDPNISRQYVSLAIRIGMKCRVRLPASWKWRICKGCNTLLTPGVNCFVRIRSRRNHHIVMHCLNCGRISRRNVR